MQRLSPDNFGASGSIPTKHFSYDVPTDRDHNMGIILEGRPPKIWEGQKLVQNFARFLTTFDFDREYPGNGSTYRKSET